MIEAGIKILQFVRSTCHFDTAQVTVPDVLGFLSCTVEIPVCQLLIHILTGTVYTDCRNGYFHQQLFVRLHVETH